MNHEGLRFCKILRSWNFSGNVFHMSHLPHSYNISANKSIISWKYCRICRTLPIFTKKERLISGSTGEKPVILSGQPWLTIGLLGSLPRDRWHDKTNFLTGGKHKFVGNSWKGCQHSRGFCARCFSHQRCLSYHSVIMYELMLHQA